MMDGKGKEESLPPGFRFHPTDEELITYYLLNKISDSSFTGRAIGDVDLNKTEPWDLPGKAKMGEKEWYFFSLRDRKYPTGVRTNRATNSGYWKTTGKDKDIFSTSSDELEIVGMKKTLVFYRGRAPRGEKTNWVMHEYRGHSRSKSSFRTAKDEWVVCRVFQKTAGLKKYPPNQTRAVNAYNMEIGEMMQADNYHFSMGRNHAELAELSRVLYGAQTPSSTLNLPFQPQINYPFPAPGFTISGLNLNLGSASTQPSMPPPLLHQQDARTSTSFVAENGYGEEINHNTNGIGNRYLNVDLDNYWPAY